MPMVMASALITGAASVDKFDKVDTQQKEKTTQTNTKNPVGSLLTAGIFSLVGLYDDKKSRSLVNAISHSNLENAKILLQLPDVDPNFQLENGNTALGIAVEDKNLDVVKELLKHPKTNPNIQNNDDNSPLIRAVNDNNMEIFKLLLQHPNIDIDIQDKEGDTALVIATRRDKQEFVNELLKYEALNKKNKLEKQPVQQKHDETFNKIRDILMSNKVKTSQGAYLNSTNFISNVIDYLLESVTKEEKQEIIKLLKSLKNLSYNKTDGNRISAIEKILNAEDFDLLELLKGKDLEYKRDFDYAFNRIENDEFKQEVVNLKFTFKDLKDAINIESIKAIDKCKEQFESPLFSATKNGKELWNSVCKHWDNKSFVLGFIEQYYKYCSE